MGEYENDTKYEGQYSDQKGIIEDFFKEETSNGETSVGNANYMTPAKIKIKRYRLKK